MGDFALPCDLCGRQLGREDMRGYVDALGDDAAFDLVFHKRCATKVIEAIHEARMTGAATLVKP